MDGVKSVFTHAHTHARARTHTHTHTFEYGRTTNGSHVVVKMEVGATTLYYLAEKER
jgi:hypothetical protein